MNVFEVVKENVTARQAAEAYSLKVGRTGMACCPFHSDKSPSMKLDERYYCFGCGATGDAVDLTAKLFGIELKEAAVKLAEDFGLNYASRQKPSIRPRIREPTPEQKYQKEENNCYKVLTDYFHLLREWEKKYAPKQPDEEWNDEYGSEAADIIVSENGTLVAEDLRNGFDAEAGFAISEYLEENGASVYDLKELPADTDIVLYDGKELYTEKAQPIINDSWDYSMVGIDENGEEYRFNFYEIHSVATEKGLRLKMPELHYIDHYYVVEDLQKQGKLDIREYSSLSEALENYFALPTHKMKALGIQNQSPLPGSLDFIQCKNGVDHLTEDWTKVTGWLNPQIYQTVQYLKESLEVHEIQIAYDTGIGFFAIQHTDGGYDYTFYDKDYLEKDGGVYDDPEFTIEEAAGDLLAEEGISIHDCKVMDYEELMEYVENAEKEQQAEPSLTYYVAECMEFSVLGEYHADLTIDEAFDIYKRIPSDRMNGGKGIGICLQEDSLYAGEYPLMRSNQIDMETLEGIPYMKNHPLVQQAVKEMEQRGVKLWYPIKEAQAEKGAEQRQEQPQRESKKESVLKALKERQERLKAQQTEPKRPERSQSKKKGDMEL